MRIFSYLFLLLLSTSSLAASKAYSPFETINQTGDKLFTRIAASQQQLEKFPELMRDIVEQELMPVIDYRYASYKILGKQLKKTSKEQREKFVQAMRHYLIRTYANALNQYKDQQVIYEDGKIKANAKMTSVNATIIDGNKPDIHITFQMRKNKKTGQWKAYDMVVEGISLLSSKRAEFSNRIAKYGIDQVIVELAAISS
ncbi:organic solvent ABC transporter substrate-binding protein [Thalassotalea insulae]|uniref:Organic solvent ABC transporter substrate-binding protein n=1 Tax=Thalassotalea insulae TaxID=2056778 RepID=A0ABQ6GV10_9GAMM|nr:ABC transporter substrate-binding protein [Thalassotalea insulae]GLX79773.1 organic solvent ABC transporter substrate-binding protein [Thalassotalea insulae]